MSGEAERQAGSHPFALSTSFDFNVSAVERLSEPLESITGIIHPTLNAAVKSIHVALPPGLTGDPLAVPRCTQTEFQLGYGYRACPADTQVGYVYLYFYGKLEPQELPVFNIEPPPGQPAELGFTYAGRVHVPLFFHVRTEGDYGVTADATEINASNPLRGGILTLWGVPADPRHDPLRRGSNECNETLGCPSRAPAKPFLTLPTSCAAAPLGWTLASDTWQGGEAAPRSTTMPGTRGCEALSFDPQVSAAPDTTRAAAPSGYTVDVKVPQDEEPGSLATPHVRRIAVTLPAGTVVSASAANGLAACPESGEEGVNLHVRAPAKCPAASKIGAVEVVTPLLEAPLKGSVYLAQQGNGGSQQGSNPFGSLMAAYVVVEGSGVIVKQAGEISANPVTGQLTTTFTELPQLPFSELKVHVFGGPGAALSNPAGCGAATTSSQLTPWTNTGPAVSSNSFTTTGCTSTFAPSLVAGSTSNQAGAFSPFSLSFARNDGEEELATINQTLPPGVLGKIAGVARCSDAELAQLACTPASRIGSVTLGVGAGPNPYYVHGSVYLTSSYRGAPFGEAVVVPAIAGPYNLGTVVVRGAIAVDPRTAQVSVVSDRFPTILQGIPVQLRSATVMLDREGFMFNPTSCSEEATTGTITGVKGTSAAVSSRFQAANCARLPFKPTFKASTQASSSKAYGASLRVSVASGAGQANIGKVKVDLPIQLPSRLSTLHKACTDTVFEANPAACPAPSVVGTVTVHTPVLSVPLTGPAYLVSHGGAALPDLVFVLQGEGVTVLLDGKTTIKKGVTSESFESVPDVPVTSFESVLPEGPFSVLAANLPTKAKGSFCKQVLSMPTRITGQNGAIVSQSTKVTVAGCPKAKVKRKAKKASRAHRSNGHLSRKGS
ncbi:MAG: hypothetical protein ACYDHN_11040 [Solirubrobacteraceae bacterium]